MLIAKQKKKENIAEYVLYMWQLEDILRACSLNIESVKAAIVDRYTDLQEEVRCEMIEWYDNLIEMMKKEQIESKGHLQVIKNTVSDMNDLHNQLLQTPKEIQYNALFFKTLPFLVEFRNKLKAGEETDDIELSLNALYGVLLLKLQKKEVTKETQVAIEHISKFIATLSAKYKADANGEIEWD